MKNAPLANARKPLRRYLVADPELLTGGGTGVWALVSSQGKRVIIPPKFWTVEHLHFGRQYLSKNVKFGTKALVLGIHKEKMLKLETSLSEICNFLPRLIF